MGNTHAARHQLNRKITAMKMDPKADAKLQEREMELKANY